MSISKPYPQFLNIELFSELPWGTCGNWWNTDKCRPEYSSVGGNISCGEVCVSSVKEFWELVTSPRAQLNNSLVAQ